MDLDVTKNYEELVDLFTNYYGHVIPISNIKSKDDQLDLISYLQQFLMRLLFKASQRLPFNDGLLQSIQYIFPNCFNGNEILNIAKRFTNIIPYEKFHTLYEELGKFKNNLPTLKMLYVICKDDIIQLYSDLNVSKSYPLFTTLATALLSFPHSTVEAERLFSQLKLIKTDRRMNLKSETIESLLLTKYHAPNFNDDKVFEEAQIKYLQVNNMLNDQVKENLLKRRSSNISPDLAEQNSIEKNNESLKQQKLNSIVEKEVNSSSAQESVKIDL